MAYIGQHYISVEQLSKDLGVTPGELVWCAHHMSRLVSPVSVQKKDGTSRNVIAPNEQLKFIQKRIKNVFFDNYEYPPYVHGLGGDSLKDHASVHLGSKCLIKIDMRDFFPSIGYKRVYSMWTNVFGLPADLARILTKMSTFGGSLQQGFPTSSHIAAVIAEDMGMEMVLYCTGSSLKFSQYVDDLNISGPAIDKARFFKDVIPIAHRHGFSVKRRKTTVLEKQKSKLITGVVVTGEKVRSTREVRRRAFFALKAHLHSPDDISAAKRLSGYARFIGGLRKSDGKALRSKSHKE